MGFPPPKESHERTDPAPPPAAGHRPGEARPGATGLATAALVLGTCALVLCWVPLVNLLAALAGATGTVIGIVAIVRARRTGVARVRAITGTALSASAVVATLVLTVVAVLLFSPHALRAAEASVLDRHGQTTGPMTDDVQVDECYDIRDGLQAVGVTVTNSTATPKRYRVSVTAYDDAGHPVGYARASSHLVEPGASELIADSALVSAPVAECVVSEVTRS